MVMIGRRDLLVRTGLLLASSALASLVGTSRASAVDVSDWAAVRALFPLTPDVVHLGGLYIASHPAPVRQAIEAHRQALDENPVHHLQDAGGRLELRVLQAAASYLGADLTDIALTDSTTMGLALLYSGLSIRADQEILTTTHDFLATHEPLRQKALSSGARLRFIELYDASELADEDAIVAVLRAAIGRRTRVVAVTWVHSSSGVRLPIGRLAEVVAAANRGRDEADQALLCVDGVHGLGVEHLSMAELGCDFFVSGCHKWLLGPRGTGFVWGAPQAWPAASPTIPSFSDQRSYGGTMTPGGFHSFEHRWALNEAFDLHLAIGKARVAARIHALNRQLKEGLAAMGHVRLRTPMADALSAGIVCFDIEGLAPRTAVARLRAEGVVATVTPYARPHARLAAGLMNSSEDVEAALRAVRALG